MPTESKNIFIIGTRCFGISKSRIPQIKYFQERGFKVYVLASNDKDSEKIKNNGAQVIDVPFLSYNVVSSVRAFWILLKSHLKYKPKLTIVYNTYPILINSASCFLFRNLTINVFTGRGSFLQVKSIKFFISKMVFILFVRKTRSKVITQNKEDKKFIKEFLNVRDVKLIQSSGVDIEHFTSSKLSSNSIIKVLCLSRILPDKGVLEYLKAVLQLKGKYEDVRFVLGGEIDKKNLNSDYIDEIDKLILDSGIEYIGYSSSVKELLNTIDIFVYPSYYPEGVPRICLEAASMELPIITTNARGCNVTVIDNESGYLVPVKSVDEIVDKLKLLIEDELMRIKMGKAGRVYMKQDFASDIINEQYFNFFDKTLK